MELLIIILGKEEYFETVLSILAELEVSDSSTIIEGEKLGQFLADRVPIFAGLREMMGQRKTACKVIMTLVEKNKFMPGFTKLLAEENIDFTRPDTGAIITIPVDTAITSR